MTVTLPADTAERLSRAAQSLATPPEDLALRILTLVLQSASMSQEERRAGFAALADLRGELFRAGLPEAEGLP